MANNEGTENPMEAEMLSAVEASLNNDTSNGITENSNSEQLETSAPHDDPAEPQEEEATKVRQSKERLLERSDSKSIAPPFYITNSPYRSRFARALPLVASLLTSPTISGCYPRQQRRECRGTERGSRPTSGFDSSPTPGRGEPHSASAPTTHNCPPSTSIRPSRHHQRSSSDQANQGGRQAHGDAHN